MKNKTRAQRRRAAKVRKTLLAISMMLVVAFAAIGGTIAWLSAETKSVVNTFTTSDISITLKENETVVGDTDVAKDFKMIPGYQIAKKPTVEVTTGSQPCYVFVVVEESDNLKNYIDYKIADEWTAGTGPKDAGNGVPVGVYYRVIDDESEQGVEMSILKGDSVQVLDSVDKTAMSAAETNKPTLSFTAYASQYMKSNTEHFEADEAWNNAKPADSGSGN